MKTQFIPHRRQGMVLIELITALTIFTLVAFSLVMALNSAFEAAKARNEIEMATRGLENQIALLHAARVNPIDKDLDDDGSGITYHLLVEPVQLQDQKQKPVPNIYRVTITAKWKSGVNNEDRSVSELIYQP